MILQIDNAVKHARRYWFVDGFTEMITGGLFILLAGLLLFSGHASPGAFASWFLSVAGKIAIAKSVGILVGALVLWWLKDHFTYPRTGFVRLRQATTKQVLVVIRNVVLFLLLPIFGLLTASLLITSTGNVLSFMPVWLPVGVGLLWAILLTLASEWMGLQRFRLLSLAMLLAGLAVGIWELATGLPTVPANNASTEILQPAVLEIASRALIGLSLLVLITGLILIFSGLITFLRYRKENPTPYAEDV